jgi:Polyketide cyclase / dehydrase and lipid transport
MCFMDVAAKRVIRAPKEKVAGYVMDWRNDPEWTAIKTVTLSREAEGGGYGVGAQVTRSAYFLGRRTDYVMDVERFEPPDLIALRSVQAPVRMRVTYQFQPHPEGTLATVIMRTDDGRMARLAGPLMRALLRATADGDLKKLADKVS